MTMKDAIFSLKGASVVLGLGGLALVPVFAPPFYANLLVPFFGYAIALLGFNLLFGYTGLLSFGHAMFIGLGAYGAAVVAGVLRVGHFEVVLLAVIVTALLVALPIGFLCVRYSGIFFGMLTLAFGMLAHSFLFKFYSLRAETAACACPACGSLDFPSRISTRPSSSLGRSTTTAWAYWCCSGS